MFCTPPPAARWSARCPFPLATLAEYCHRAPWRLILVRGCFFAILRCVPPHFFALLLVCSGFHLYSEVVTVGLYHFHCCNSFSSLHTPSHEDVCGAVPSHGSAWWLVWPCKQPTVCASPSLHTATPRVNFPFPRYAHCSHVSHHHSRWYGHVAYSALVHCFVVTFFTRIYSQYREDRHLYSYRNTLYSPSPIFADNFAK